MGCDDWYGETEQAKEKKRHEDAAKWLNAMENAVGRAETARKDIDLIIIMRAVYHILKHLVKN